VARPRARGEFALIARHFAPLAKGYPLAHGLTDDTAALRAPPGEEIVVTTDGMVAGVHFFADDPPGLIARKLLRVNLSDLAAKGARPFAYTLVAAFGSDTEERWIARFARGLALDQERFDCALIGGDTVATPGPLWFSVTAFGRLARGRAPLRGAAAPGQDIWVSGTIGDAALGLRLRQGDSLPVGRAEARRLLARHRLPEPRVALGIALRGLAIACCDVSDGLAADLAHICDASAVGAEVEAAKVPLSAGARACLAGGAAGFASLVSGGDDYELCFTASPRNRGAVVAAGRRAGVAVTRIGSTVGARSGVRFRDADGRELRLDRAGYTHF